jgi:hypothetical protein
VYQQWRLEAGLVAGGARDPYGNNTFLVARGMKMKKALILITTSTDRRIRIVHWFIYSLLHENVP